MSPNLRNPITQGTVSDPFVTLYVAILSFTSLTHYRYLSHHLFLWAVSSGAVNGGRVLVLVCVLRFLALVACFFLESIHITTHQVVRRD
jgi:uncharacterized membrane protein